MAGTLTLQELQVLSWSAVPIFYVAPCIMTVLITILDAAV